jgi:tol-pal system protein YbgF
MVLVLGLVPGPSFAQEDASVGARVSRLEAEIATLKVMVGTLESLLRANPGATLPRDGGSVPQPSTSEEDLGPRVAALETQIGALTNQLEQIGRQMSALGARLSAAPQAAPQAVTPVPQPENFPPPSVPAPVFPDEADDESDGSGARWYGPKPGEDEGGPQSITPQGSATGSVTPDMPQSLVAFPDSNAQALYEQGYGDFLQRDYPGAETAFGKLVKEYPDDPLAGSAIYWVGETYYVRGQYKKAADTFLSGHRKYSSGDKAPDTLLKLGMSLAALGQKDAACSTFSELEKKFPDAPDHLRQQAKGESGKAGC